ncbi:MAG: VanZ family protein [Chloroflexi bacterium]|nr:VanZ family protein [Chloroflexota bacterium]
MKRFLWHWFPPLAWMGLIFVLSAQPDLPHAAGRWLDLLLKKAGHAAVYGVLAWLYRRTLRRHIPTGTVLRAVSIGLAVAYAASDEYHQTFVPGRNGNLVDVAVDGVGACGAMLLARWREGRRELPRPESVVR